MANARSTGRIDLAAAATGLAKGSPDLGVSRSHMAAGGRIRTGLLRIISSIGFHYCRECEARFACHGECPKNRFIKTPDREDGRNSRLLREGRFADEILQMIPSLKI
jgi:hypothetical protein